MAPKVRVLHVLNDLSGGGAERLVLDLCRHATDAVAPRVATVKEGGGLTDAFAAAGVEVLCTGRRRFRPGLGAVWKLKGWCHSADVVHTHLWGGDFFGGIGGWAAGKPVVSTVHNTRGDGVIRDWVLKAGPSPDQIVGVSPAACDRSLRASGLAEQRIVIPNGVDLSRFSPTPFPSGPPWRLLAVGRLTAQKGIDILIRALEGVESVELHVVGEGEEEGALRALARRLGVEAHFHGWISDIASYYAQSHALVLPSRWEGFGLVAVEAMASGRPVISSAVDGLAEVLGDVGIRTQGDRVEDLRRAIGLSLEDPSGLRERGLAGPAQAGKFGIERTVRKYEKLYMELASRPIGA